MVSDINECKEGNHNCGSNAVCNNTNGSYNCTCKPGYEGSGYNCTGNFFVNLAILDAFESTAVFTASMIICSLYKPFVRYSSTTATLGTEEGGR